MAGILDIPGYGGFLQKGQLNQQQAMGELQGVLGQVNAMQNMQQMQHQRAMQPLQQQMLQAQMGEMQRKSAYEQQKAADRQSLPPVEYMKKYHPEVIGPLMIKESERKDEQGYITRALGRAGADPIPEPPPEIGGGPGRPGVMAIPGVLDQYRASDNPQIQSFAAAIQQLAESGAYKDRADFNKDVAGIATLQSQIADRQAGRDQTETMRREMQAAGIAAEQRARADRAALAGAITGGGGAPRLTPAPFSVNGQNVFGFRDPQGNLYDSTRRPVLGSVAPPITPSDQARAVKDAESMAMVNNIDNALNVLTKLVANNPRSSTGLLSGAMKFGEGVRGQVDPRYAGPGRQVDQIASNILTSLESLGKLTAKDMEEIKSQRKIGFGLGSPKEVENWAKMVRAKIGVKEAGTQVPAGRAMPTNRAAPAVNIDSLVDKYTRDQ